MKKWLRRARGAIGMGVAWALIWAVFGVLIGIASNLLPFLPWHYFFSVWDAPLPALGMPGFFGGLLFSLVLGVAARHRRFDELSVTKVAAWGALGGLLVGLIPGAMVAVGLAHLGRDGLGVWKLTALIAGPLVVLSSASAVGSLLLARMAGDRGIVADDDVDEDAGDLLLSEGDVREARSATRDRMRG
jgi:hypothetical protein